jgi:ferric-dicitrate binding protein FerR (iron transport regulator)
MSDTELKILLMGYLDGELEEADRARVEKALEADADLKREYEEMRALKDLTTGLDARGDAELEAFWGGVYNRLERHTAWVLLVVGLIGMVSGACYLFFTDPNNHWVLKSAGACALVGSLLLLWSVWRERSRLLPHDRYHREVHR